MKGITETIRHFTQFRKRVKLDDVVNYEMNYGNVDESGTDFRRKYYEFKTASSLNQMDFYSVGDGEYAHISVMTDKEREQKSKEFFSKGNAYIANGEKFIQGRINLETMEIEFPGIAETM